MTPERWLTAGAFPDYEVSDQGRVRRRTASRGTRPGKVLRPGTKADGTYQQVNLHKDGRGYSVKIHTLVAAAFIGPCPSGHVIDHRDFNTKNNVWTNLHYVTIAENNRLSVAAGRQRPPVTPRGEEHKRSKLTATAVVELRRRHAAGASYSDLSATFGISKNQVWQITARRAWAHLKDGAQ